MKEMMTRLFEWNFWSDRLTLHMIGSCGGSEKSLKLMAHILAAERIWLTRLEGGDSRGIEVHPAFDLDKCEEYLDENQEAWMSFLETLEPEKLFYLLHYTNQSGCEFENTVADILLHVTSHGHYHRGQINAEARAAGCEPVLVDFIVFTREVEKIQAEN